MERHVSQPLLVESLRVTSDKSINPQGSRQVEEARLNLTPSGQEQTLVLKLH